MLPAAEVAFGPYLLDSRTRSLSRGGEPVGLSPHEFEVLHLLVRRPNVVVSKDALIRAGWHDTAVGDNSLEKLVGKLRRQLDAGDLNRYIKTVTRQGLWVLQHGGTSHNLSEDKSVVGPVISIAAGA